MVNIDRYKIESEEKWRKWTLKIPSIKFDPEWSVRIIPPFGGAMARFLVEANGSTSSIYLDCNNSLGYKDGPYWEVCPVNGDVGRCMIDETDKLILLIRESLNS